MKTKRVIDFPFGLHFVISPIFVGTKLKIYANHSHKSP